MKSTMRILALAVIVMFAFMSCAQQPTQQMDAAKAAVQAVEGAKGMIYAKDELTKLKSDLQAAMDEVTAQSKKFFKKYGPAKEMLAKVVTDADAVKAQIPGRIEEAKKAAEAAMNEAKAAYDGAKALLEKAPKGKGTKADIEAMKADLSGLEPQMTEVQNAITAEDYFGAKDKAMAVKDKAAAIAAQVQKAIDKVKGKR
ncbi:MAG: hypothetical protein ABR951_10095 [Candidatus Aminicenantales bacterium]|jgi:hypothetical protein